jgi:hypothetical protein
MRLNPAHPCAASWRQLLDAAGADLRAGGQPWLAYPIVAGTGGTRLRKIPVLPGPMIYAVPEWNGWLYVGKTEQTLTERLAGHLRDPDRAARWHTVMAILLDPDVSTARLGQMERAGRNILAPRTGSRWSTGATA